MPSSVGNPFSTKHVRPGAVPYCFSDEQNAALLLARLEEQNWWGAILGPHGSGKSTLLQTLLPEFHRSGRQVQLVVCQAGWRHHPANTPHGSLPNKPLPWAIRFLRERLPNPRPWDVDWQLPFSAEQRRQWHSQTQVIVDGYQQLGRAARFRLRRACRRRGCGLLVTAHQDVGLPPLVEITPSPKTFRRLVRQLLAQHEFTLPDATLDAVFHRHRGNIREALFELYDLYEAERRGER